MPKLQQIVLQGNQISSFEKDTFILSPQMNMISLQENELQEGFCYTDPNIVEMFR